MDNYKKAMKLSEQLLKYSEIEGSEIGETCTYLINLIPYESYLSDDFYNCLLKEIEKQLNNFKKNCKIVIRKVKKNYSTKELEWLY